MKTWQVVVLLGAAGFILVVVVLAKPKVVGQSPQSGFAPPNQLGGLAMAIGGLFQNKAVSPSAAPNEGTYRTDIKPDVSGNTLRDPNTGKELTYGTD